MNSPWGMMWSIQKETGWSDEYLLWEIAWVNVRLKTLDAPYYQYHKNAGKRGKDIETEKELIGFLSKNSFE